VNYREKRSFTKGEEKKMLGRKNTWEKKGGGEQSKRDGNKFKSARKGRRKLAVACVKMQHMVGRKGKKR